MMSVMADRLETGIQADVEVRDFGAWMASEQKRVFLLCRRMLQDTDEADSATQDVFLKAFKALSKAEPAALENPGKWVARIAVNTCLDRLRSRAWQIWRRRPAADDERQILDMTAEQSPDAEAQLFAKQIQRRLDAALERLSPRQRAVFTLRHYEGLSLEEIAAALDLDLGTAKVHLFRAIGKLREELKDIYTARSGGTVATQTS
jgi:RNA polymerase sigma-70 factor (ECF subfamily)